MQGTGHKEDGLIEIGYISGAQGLGGEVKFFHDSGERERLESVKEFFLRGGERDGSFEVESLRYKGRIPIVKLAGVDSRNAAEAMVGAKVFVDAEMVRPTEEDSFFVSELLGMDAVAPDGSALGKVKQVIDNPAHDILVIEGADGKEFLVPMVDVFVKNVDTEKKEIIINPPKV
jgi:16S rRNA processing protein RimM